MKHAVEVFMLNKQIQINSNVVHHLHINLFKAISETYLVYKSLHWVKLKLESLVLCGNRTP